jgi:hypothetical protein
MAYEIWFMNYFGTCKIFMEIQQKKHTEGFFWQTFFYTRNNYELSYIFPGVHFLLWHDVTVKFHVK